MTETVKKPMGFAAMTSERRKAISSVGGKAAYAQGVGHRWTSEEARVAGKKGGMAAQASRAQKAA